MTKKIYTLLSIIVILFLTQTNAKSQCQANYIVYQDTTVGAPAHTYIGENLCQGANMIGVDTINYTYTWTWGDGSSTVAPFPSHTYATTGNYYICVFMNPIPPANCADSFCINATINKNSAMATISFKKPSVVASVSNTTENLFSIFPNPVFNNIMINGLKNELYQISIFTMDGRLVQTNSLVQNESIDVNNLNSGLYLLYIHSKSSKSTFLKFYKN